jgi:hypothetical protein
MNIFAQKQSFDLVTYSYPKGWQQQQNAAGVQLSVTDKKTNGYAIAIVTKAIASNNSASENFNNQWASLVKTAVTVNGSPTIQAPVKNNGWDIISGMANYTDGANKGQATLLCATGGGQTISVVLMTNTQQYQNELTAFKNSLEIAKVAATSKNNKVPATVNTNNSALVGKIWEGNMSENFVGGTLNGYYTGGFFKWQYQFNANGTYKFIYVGASAYTEPNLLQYETGTYTANGNQLTISPSAGSNEEWSVVGGPVKLAAMNDVQIRNIKSHWGQRIKTEKRKLEKVTYNFKIEYWQSNNSNALIMEYSGGHTEREGNGKVANYYDIPPAKSVKLPAAFNW